MLCLGYVDRIKRQRQTKKAKKSNHFNTFVLIFGIVEPLFTLPQVWQVWVDKQTMGVSELTWFFYTFTGFVWVAYGIQQKDKPITASSIMWVILEGSVFFGVLVRR
jgi:uncharacterized protein with PQ loop repeat